jgi:hypothetical protein
MKWAFAIQRKIRLAIALAIMMLIVILLSLLESYNVNKVAKSFHSIYEDRLIPAVDLYLISGHIQSKQNNLVLFLFTDNMKAIAFSTMVDIAEKEFNIPIRKKYNTKPSKKADPKEKEILKMPHRTTKDNKNDSNK